jgi:signal transduction histidine kinase
MKVLAASLLSEENVDPAVYREFLEDIDSEIDRENKIISDLLALVKEDRTNIDLEMTETDINELAETVMKRMRPIAEIADIAMTLINRREVRAEVDSTRISLVLTNLIENAIKYNREHGEVTVTVDADEEYFTLSVADNGIGIPEEDQAHIFERFFRVDKSRSREIGGTGLGLSITKSAILRHHGTISVESKEGEGTTFTVRIPLHYSVQPMELEVDKQRRQITRFLRRRKNRTAQKEYLEKTIQVSRRKYKPARPDTPDQAKSAGEGRNQ